MGKILDITTSRACMVDTLTMRRWHIAMQGHIVTVAMDTPPARVAQHLNRQQIHHRCFSFFNEKYKQWIIAPTLGSTKGTHFGSVEKSLAKCPGDPPATGNWQRKSSILGRWKKEPALKVACETNL